LRSYLASTTTSDAKYAKNAGINGKTQGLKKEASKLFIVLVVIIVGLFYLQSTKIPTSSELISGELKDGIYPQAPELVGISGYLNVEDIKIADLRGKVVIIDFWTYTCINCIRTLPHLVSWDEKYRDEGLVIIGVHTPEFEYEKDYDNVQNALDKHNIKYPVVQDNDYGTWRAYANQYWPHKFIIDSEGFIRYDHIGEGGYVETERVIQELLSEISDEVPKDLTGVTDNTPRTLNTKELYAGYKFALPRGQNPGGDLKPEENYTYTIPNKGEGDTIYLDGNWFSTEDDLILYGDEGKIVLNFMAKSANIVAGGSGRMEVLIGGEYVTPAEAGDDVVFEDGKAFVVIEDSDLYNVFRGDYGRRTLELRVDKDFFFSAFTFG